MAQLTLTQTTAPLGLDPVWRAAPFRFTGVQETGITTYRAQLWRRPQAVLAASPVALATTYGTAADGVVNLDFTEAQMDFALNAAEGAQDDIWLSISGLRSDGQVAPLRAGWLRVMESGCLGDGFIADPITWTLQDDIVRLTQNGAQYDLLAVQVTTPGGAVDGHYLIENDHIIFTSGGISYDALCAQSTAPSGLEAGGLIIINDVLYSMVGAQAYRSPVVHV